MNREKTEDNHRQFFIPKSFDSPFDINVDLYQ